MRGWEKFLVGEVLHQSENSTLSETRSRGLTLHATFCLVISRTAEDDRISVFMDYFYKNLGGVYGVFNILSFYLQM